MRGPRIHSTVMPSEARHHSASIGEAMRVASRVQGYQRVPLAQFCEWMTPPTLLDQLRLFYTESAICVGYATWAYFTPPIAERYLRDKLFVPRIDQWKEGRELWIVDFVALPGAAPAIAKQLLNDIGSGGIHEVNYLRRYSNGRSENTRRAVLR